MKKLVFLATVMILIPELAHAVDAVGFNGVDQMLDSFKTKTSAWGVVLERLALGSFGSLTIIDLVYYVGIRVTLSKGDLSDFAQALVQEVIILSVFFFVLTSFATVGPLIIAGFQYAAQQAGGAPTQPSQIFVAGVSIGGTVYNAWSILHPGDSITMAFCGVIVMGCFALIAVGMIYVIIESYFVVSAGQILLLFGGIRLTQDIVTSLLRNVIAIGLKLFAMQLVASIGTAFVLQWVASVHQVPFEGILVIMGEAIILAALTISIPHMFGRMIGNIATGGAGSVIGSAATIAGAAAAIGKAATSIATSAGSFASSAAGIGAAVGAAGNLAGTQNPSQGGGALAMAERIASIVGSTVQNLAESKMEDITRGLAGQRTAAGSSPWRMTASMSERARVARERATPASTSQGSNEE